LKIEANKIDRILKKAFTLKERIVTGIFLVLLVLGIGYIDLFALTWIFLTTIYVVAIFEAIKIFKIRPNIHFYTLGILFSIISIFIENPTDIFFIGLVIYLSILAYRPTLKSNKFLFTETDKEDLLLLVYPTLPFLAIFELYKNFGNDILLFLLISVALTDTMAYFVGKGVGKTKFSVTSPKKTLEGVFGGIIFGTVGGFFIGEMIFPNFSNFQIFLISFAVSISSVFGDLFESYIKRVAEIKDSGNFLPGHGGVLDRVDGYLLSSIILVVILK
jgi:phosphatidate cytidylyltransferase